MDLSLIIVLYVLGLGLILLEALMPGVVLGLIGTAALVTSIVFGFQHHWALGTGQIVLAALAAPVCIYLGFRRMTLRTSLNEGAAFAENYSAYAGREGEALTDLRPAGMILIDGHKVDVVTAGESVAKGARVRVTKVEGNRVVVKAV
ncbi:MAG: hypothetical protein HY716_15910 [Planctomycetes bacterium]|nr:hypothetical protein [Planctomycetota bacterium]